MRNHKPMLRCHATAVACDGAGVLLRGPSGAGKSDLALRLIDCGAALVADDQVLLSRSDQGNLVAAPPSSLAGLIEIRGLGIVQLPHAPMSPLRLIVDLVAREAVERLPEPDMENILSICLPRVYLYAFDASTPAKIRLRLRHRVERHDA